MTSNDPDQKSAAGPRQAPADEQAIVADIEQTRAALADTVSELAAKADVKARARTAAAGLRARSAQAGARVRTRAAAGGYWVPAVAIAAGLVLFVTAIRNARRT
jgi:Protein of unknown function (DUF3618)